MTIWYAVEESPYKWAILASSSFLAGLFGTILMIVYNWPHMLARIWFWAGVVVALFCLARLVLQWKAQVDEMVESESARTSLKQQQPLSD